MLGNLEVMFRDLAYRRAVRAIGRVQSSSWFLGELLGNRLRAGLATPAEVLATIGAWQAAAQSGREPGRSDN